MEISFDDKGLVTAIVQDRLTGQVRMVGYMNRDALAATLATSRATFFSRSRQKLWEKGESSGHSLRVASIYADCDADALLLLVDPIGPTCHTGSPSCFFRRLGEGGKSDAVCASATAFLEELERSIEARKQSSADKSYTRHLLDGGATRIGEKLREESAELSQAIASETDDRVASEAADVFYHVLVGLASRSVPLRAVLEKLAARSGTSGHEEKRSRNP